MPIEIKELVVKAEVDEQKNTRRTSTTQSSQSKENTEQMIEECVERVLTILRKSKQR